ncbi:glycerophosphodiester phosphodiesterase [Halomicroarcula sp. F13]|uniref:Glycerophosphodiester phosphodiesterase n=1 Tax=Haloarcula rubra TaxID=2487747 RepID=A0AAW4PYN6_9EURY|nr:glycerophosphodiester phosphodiesterase [Halomicroarcula rubra]MBX0325655.1 glycerophosphodiester phosphodiesterase [Halomicroarcula rubra]
MHTTDSKDDNGDEGTRARTDGGDLRIIGHRGCADQYPENTVFAVEQSAPHVDMIEIDVQRCESGELVVFHDDKLDRLTDATGSVETTDWETLRELQILDSDETIPLLSELLDAVPTDTAVNIELKHEGMASEILEAASAVPNEVLISSFSVTALREVRERDEEAALALVIYEKPDRNRSIAMDLDCVAINPGYEMVLGTDFVKKAHADGLGVNTWTIDDAATADRVRAAGVDGVFVDRWDIV